MVFEWNEEKANARKHGVAFRETATVLGDPRATAFAAPDHSLQEQRYLAFGVCGALSSRTPTTVNGSG